MLALLYIQDGKYNEARKELNATNKIECEIPSHCVIPEEVREKLKELNQNKKKRKKDDLVSFQDGNDTIVMPSNSFRDMIDSTRASVVDISGRTGHRTFDLFLFGHPDHSPAGF